ncbi:hypothetical protein EVAR_28714_1 [Eumeta japonica]|uniref:Uncharacterized protein n=1 Tax=Eumeta variegata TaxID=151549 RepID=A0A4C1V4P8_EUMVA|nr:hypothetical protein EVAR_28714_1 [Eumeta japonica]
MNERAAAGGAGRARDSSYSDGLSARWRQLLLYTGRYVWLIAILSSAYDYGWKLRATSVQPSADARSINA